MMKRISNLFVKAAMVAVLTLFGAFNALADTETFSYSDYNGNGTQSSGSSYTMNGTNVSITNTKFYGNDSYAHFYANAVSTITPGSGVTITGITLTAYSSSYNGYQSSGKITASTGTCSGSGTSVTWTGSTSSAFTISNNKQIRWTSIVVTYTVSGGTPTCATPTFSPVAGTYVGAQNVEVSTTTDGATIHYTTNGDDPTESSAIYSSAIPVNSTTTIKAITVKDGYDDSEIASATYTIINPIPGYAIDFESAPVAYVDWEMSNIGVHTSGLTAAHGGSAWGSNVNESDNAVSTASITTKEKVDYPNIFTCYISKESSNTTSSTWKIQVSSDGNIWNDIASLSTMTQNTWTEFVGNIKESGYTNVFVRLFYSGSNAKRAVDDISLTTYTPSSIAIPTFSIAAGTYKSAQTVALTTETDGATIYYTTDGSVPTTSSTVYSSPISVSSNTTIKAIASKAGEDSEVASASYTILNIHQGTSEDPYTVADAKKAIDDGTYVNNVYVSGVVSRFYSTDIVSDGTYYRYYISDDGSTSSDLLVYKGNGLNNVAFSNADDLLVGDQVIIYGSLTTYQSTKEINSGNYIVNLDRPVTPIVAASTSTLSGFTYAQGSGPSTTKTFTVSGSNLSGNINLSLSGSNYEISLDSGSGYGSSLVLEESEGSVSATNIYVRLKADLTSSDYADEITITSTGAENQTVSLSGSVTIPSLSYATLPFEFDGGVDDIEGKSGLLGEGIGKDYASSPCLRFDGDGDYLILHFNEAPGILTFDIKGNPSKGTWAGSFKVQVSADGSSYEDIVSYTELASTKTSKTIDNLANNVRYIKWFFDTKTEGNVALGNISLAKAAVPETIDITGTLCDGHYWATFFSSARFTLPEGAKAYTLNSSKQLYLLGTDGSIIPAKTAVIIISDSADITLTKDGGSSSVAINGGGNILLGSTSPVGLYSITGTPYVLGIKGGVLGFYEYTGDGIPAGKAYYIVND